MAAQLRHLVICGSPRANGRCARLAHDVASGLSAAHPGCRVESIGVCDADIHGCIGCGHCRTAGECVFADDMAQVMRALDAASELHIVCPVYFAGPPAQMKALLDRLQPHYWKGTRFAPKRPAHLHVVGEGGDPHGYGPLVTICRSALAVAGFELQDVTPHIQAADSAAPDAPALGGEA